MLRADPLPELEALYRRELSRYVRVARAIVGEEQAALDAVQEAFTRAVEKRRSFRRRGPLEAKRGAEPGSSRWTLRGRPAERLAQLNLAPSGQRSPLHDQGTVLH